MPFISFASSLFSSMQPSNPSSAEKCCSNTSSEINRCFRVYFLGSRWTSPSLAHSQYFKSLQAFEEKRLNGRHGIVAQVPVRTTQQRTPPFSAQNHTKEIAVKGQHRVYITRTRPIRFFFSIHYFCEVMFCSGVFVHVRIRVYTVLRV